MWILLQNKKHYCQFISWEFFEKISKIDILSAFLFFCMNFQNILQFDADLLIAATQLFPKEYKNIIAFSAETVVLWSLIFLIGSWLYGAFTKNNEYKMRSLKVFSLIASVFFIYLLVNVMIPEWRPNPFKLLAQSGYVEPIIGRPTDNSFPSGHALFAGAFIVAMCYYSKNAILIGITIFVTILTLFARIVGGIHYPGDIVAGLIISMTGALIFRPFVEKIVEKIAPFLFKIASFLKL